MVSSPNARSQSVPGWSSRMSSLVAATPNTRLPWVERSAWALRPGPGVACPGCGEAHRPRAAPGGATAGGHPSRLGATSLQTRGAEGGWSQGGGMQCGRMFRGHFRKASLLGSWWSVWFELHDGWASGRDFVL